MKEWREFLENQKEKWGKETICRWAENLKVIDFDAGHLYLEAANPLELNWFEQHLRPLLKTSFRSTNGRIIRVYVSLAGDRKSIPKKSWQPPLNLSPDAIFETCTFTSYFPGTINKCHFQLLQEALDKKNFNPIYLHGPCGVGKTHLLMAACHSLKKKGYSYFYVKADRFTEHIVAAIRSGAMLELRKLYREQQVLLIDDIEALASRSATQEELFHTFNAFHLAGKPIILAGTKLPSQIAGIEPRLTSRFEWGLTLSFHLLNEYERSLYFETLLSQKGISLDKKLIQFCLSLFRSIPFLNRAADILKVRLTKHNSSTDELTEWFSMLLQEQEQRAVSSNAILKAVSSHFDILLTDLIGKSQTKEHVIPRQIAMYLCRHKLHLPYLKIAEIFSKDHSTVMTSVKLVERKAQSGSEIKETLTEILKELDLAYLRNFSANKIE